MITPDIRLISYLCRRCGACKLVCPQQAISFSSKEGFYFPYIDYSKCNLCGRCFEVCPVKKENFLNYEKDFFSGIKNVFIGYAQNYEDRFWSSSGGIVVSIIKWSLQLKIVDAFLCVKASKDIGYAEFALIENIEEINLIRTSKYITPSMENLDYKELSKFKKIGVVGLSCHIKALFNLKEFFNLNNIYFTIGLICYQSKNPRFLKFILERMNIEKEEVDKFYYRTEGWPGKAVAYLKNGAVRRLPYKDWSFLWSNFYFTPWGCWFCEDPWVESADIVVGDPWNKKLKRQTQGLSLIISRTSLGDLLLKRAYRDGVIRLFNIHKKSIVKFQSLKILKFKKNYFKEKMLLLELVEGGKIYNKIFTKRFSVNIWKFINTFRIWLSCRILESLIQNKIFKKIPLKILRVISLLLKI
ncbi:MAG: hypothetical protein B6D55_07020 [Candidatus Omnitrophica bacterium 4484_70.2]|nr:MAG: hypothetical protein B6D55_07020 [Candidatus Omnitrophica bacterium 4484_70.2]